MRGARAVDALSAAWAVPQTCGAPLARSPEASREGPPGRPAPTRILKAVSCLLRKRPLKSFFPALFVPAFARNWLWETAQMGAYAEMAGRPRPAVALLHLVPT